MAFGAVLTVGFDGRGPRRQRFGALAVFAVAGALVTLLGNAAVANPWAGIGVVFTVTLLCSTVGVSGTAIRRRGCRSVGR